MSNWAVWAGLNVARAVNHGSNAVRTARARQRVTIRQRNGVTEEASLTEETSDQQSEQKEDA